MAAERPAWARDPGERDRRPADPGDVLVDLLELADALPPPPRTELEFPPFRTLVAG
jgi:hypothetical protein